VRLHHLTVFRHFTSRSRVKRRSVQACRSWGGYLLVALFMQDRLEKKEGKKKPVGNAAWLQESKAQKPHICRVACTWALLTQEDGYRVCVERTFFADPSLLYLYRQPIRFALCSVWVSPDLWSWRRRSRSSVLDSYLPFAYSSGISEFAGAPRSQWTDCKR
jgi:hypothetical protein